MYELFYPIELNLPSQSYGTKSKKTNLQKQAELSWGSVQAETVRLQRQIDPGLRDIQLEL